MNEQTENRRKQNAKLIDCLTAREVEAVQETVKQSASDMQQRCVDALTEALEAVMSSQGTVYGNGMIKGYQNCLYLVRNLKTQKK